MDITLNFGEQYMEHVNDGILLPIFLTFLSSFLGLFTALWVDRIIKKKEIQKISEQKKLLSYYQLRYFRDTIQSVINSVPKQTNFFTSFAKELKSNPFELHSPKKLVNYDIMKLKELDTKENYESFFDFIVKNEINMALYRNCFSYASFTLQVFENSEFRVSSSANNYYNYLQKINELDIDITLLLSKRIEEIRGNEIENSSEVDFLKKLVKAHNESADLSPANFRGLYKTFFLPVYNNCREIINDKNLAINIYSISRKAINLFKNIEASTLNLSKDYLDYNLKVTNVYPIFEEIRNEIDHINKP